MLFHSLSRSSIVTKGARAPLSKDGVCGAPQRLSYVPGYLKQPDSRREPSRYTEMRVLGVNKGQPLACNINAGGLELRAGKSNRKAIAKGTSPAGSVAPLTTKMRIRATKARSRCFIPY